MAKSVENYQDIAGRHQYIINEISNEGRVYVLDLCKKLNVSSVTIRKDLKFLEDKNLLYRVHGGATHANPYAMDRHVNEKEKLQASEKNKIGTKASESIASNDSIIIASGTTALAMAKQLRPKGTLTVITSALQVAQILSNSDSIEVIMLGGQLRKTSASVMGPYAESTLNDFYCSKLFLGVDGIDPASGCTTTSVLEAHLNRKMIAVSQKTIVLADSSKFGKKGFGRICGIEDIDEIITDNGIPESMKIELESMGVKITIV